MGGPKLWSRSVPMPLTGDNDDFAVMNIDDFLSENGFEEGALSPRSNDDMDTDSEAMMEPVEMPSKKVSLKRLADTEAGDLKRSKNDNSFLYAESKRARMEREKEEKKRRAQEIEFSAQDLALATVPGMEFDPRQRAFAPDELRPQPIIRKRKKSNVAARRSREARRLKENQIALRTAYLEKENNGLKAELEATKAENMELMAEKQMLIEKLKQYE